MKYKTFDYQRANTKIQTQNKELNKENLSTQFMYVQTTSAQNVHLSSSLEV